MGKLVLVMLNLVPWLDCVTLISLTICTQLQTIKATYFLTKFIYHQSFFDNATTIRAQL